MLEDGLHLAVLFPPMRGVCVRVRARARARDERDTIAGVAGSSLRSPTRPAPWEHYEWWIGIAPEGQLPERVGAMERFCEGEIFR